MFYAIIILLTVALCEGATLAVHFFTNDISLAYALCAPLFCVLFCGLLLGVLDIIVRLLPKKLWNFDKKPFSVSKKEAKFYEKLGIKKWKDKAVPELGASAGFSKKSLKGTETEYISRFLRETCQGETLHAGGATMAFLFLVLFPVRDWYFVLPILAVNFFINLLPCMIQRYNRFRLAVVYKFKLRHAVAQSREQERTESGESENANLGDNNQRQERKSI